MGVPAFFRWISEKYPKIVVDIVQERQKYVDGTAVPMDLTKPNAAGIDFDNFYIDMNGIIHPCSHPEDKAPPESEEEMYENVMEYVDRLFAAVRPRKLLYLAIDGVAPRAKMNQQRSRRFRSAQEVMEQEEVMRDVRREMVQMGLNVPAEAKKTWDSNVITPGTRFMDRLASYLRFYIQDRIQRDPAWQSITVIFSDSNEPGEGEHKIMDFIRRQRTQPGYNPNLSHVLHGLDADLIMLGLATHEVNFTILREQVIFGGRRDKEKRAAATRAAQSIHDALAGFDEGRDGIGGEGGSCHEVKPLQMLQISTLREYLRNEFSCLERVLPFKYDFERVVDDFVFLMFFVGNDFLPHLPSLDIRDGALEFIFNVYKRVLPSLGDYLTRTGGYINLSNVDVILSEVGSVEDEVFRRRKAAEDRENIRREQGKAQRRGGGAERIGADAMRSSAVAVDGRVVEALKRKREEEASAGGGAKNDGDNVSAAQRLRKQIKRGATGSVDPTDKPTVEAEPKGPALTEEEEAAASAALKQNVKGRSEDMLDKYRSTVEDNVRLWEEGWKVRYYSDKCKVEDIESGGGMEKVFKTYIQGLCWVMQYYYQGCPSWTWYYPFHYAPFASDLINCDRFQVEFGESMPFKPIEQLMAVLPAASAAALPEPCRNLMVDPASPILDFYPEKVPCDPNGKPMPWLWVVLLPFIDEKRLLTAIESCYSRFSEAETRRNSLGPSYVFAHAKSGVGAIIQESFGSGGDGKRWLSAKEGAGCVSGTLVRGEHEGVYTTGETVEAPPFPPGAFTSINKSQTVYCEYRLPPAAPHKSELVPGAVELPPKLMVHDLQQRKAPRLNFGGMSIAELGKVPFSQQQQQQQGMQGRFFGAPRQGPFQQQPQGGRGGNQFPRGNFSYPPQPGYTYAQQQASGTQHLQTGARQWGALEPAPGKRRRSEYGTVANGQHHHQQQQYPHHQQHQQQYRGQQQQQQQPYHGQQQQQYHGQQQSWAPSQQAPQGGFPIGGSFPQQQYQQSHVQYGQSHQPQQAWGFQQQPPRGPFNGPPAFGQQQQQQQQQHPQHRWQNGGRPPAPATLPSLDSLRGKLANALQQQQARR